MDKRVALDPGLAETHLVLGFVRFREWKWQDAEAEYREALRLNPDCIPAWVSLGFELSHVGRTDEALQVIERGLLVDPNWPQLVKMKGHVYFVQRQFQKALDLYLESARREPLFAEARHWSARAYFVMTNYPAAIDELEPRDLLRGEQAMSPRPQLAAATGLPFLIFERSGVDERVWLKPFVVACVILTGLLLLRQMGCDLPKSPQFYSKTKQAS